MLTSDALRAFIISRKAKGLSSETIRWYQDILKNLIFMYQELPTTPDAIESFLASCLSGDERRHGYYRALRAFYRWLKKRYKIDNPLEFLDPPKRARKNPHALTPDELDQLFSFPHRAKVRACLLFLADTGCRVGELFHLKRADLDETPWGFVAKVRGKTGERVVPVSPETYHAMLTNLPLNWGYWYLRYTIGQAFKNAHVPGTAHTLRHTYGSLWPGNDDSTLQMIMGHASIQTTMKYRHLRTQVLSEAHRKNTPLKYVNRTRYLGEDFK